MAEHMTPHETGMFRVGGIEVIVHSDGSVLILRSKTSDRVELGDYEAAFLLRILGAMRD